MGLIVEVAAASVLLGADVAVEACAVVGADVEVIACAVVRAGVAVVACVVGSVTMCT